jgi:transposase InsO family protein
LVVEDASQLTGRRPDWTQGDNGSEIISKAKVKSAYENVVTAALSRTEKSTNNPFIEYFNGTSATNGRTLTGPPLSMMQRRRSRLGGMSTTPLGRTARLEV